MSQADFKMTAPAEVYRKRRRRMAAVLTRPLVVFAGHASSRHYATNVWPFRAGSNYLYFGGPPLEGAAWLIEPGCDGADGCYLFRKRGGFEDDVWVGPQPTDDAMAVAAGVSTSALLAPPELEGMLSGQTGCYLAPPCSETHRWIKSLALEAAGPDELGPLIEMRLTKDKHELSAMRRAADIGVEAHLAAMRAAAPGRHEGDVAGALETVFRRNEGRSSFTPIVSIRGEILHSETYVNTLESGRLLLVDAGAEEPGGYASDITRTYPVTGVYTYMQRHLYDTVLRALREATAICVPGRRFRDIHDLAARIICEGLIDADLLRGNAAELAERGAHTLFFPHGLGHLIGLDVHDMEDFGDMAGYAPGRSRRPEFGSKFLRMDRDLEPGMCLTIEPGIYLVPAIWDEFDLVKPFADVVNRSNVDGLLRERFGGIRIEDTVCVNTADAPGPEVLTSKLPSDADEVGRIVAGD